MNLLGGDRMSSEKDSKQHNAEIKKLAYQKPAVKSESLTTVAALCNGVASGGRKAVAGVSGCQAGKIKS